MPKDKNSAPLACSVRYSLALARGCARERLKKSVSPKHAPPPGPAVEHLVEMRPRAESNSPLKKHHCRPRSATWRRACSSFVSRPVTVSRFAAASSPARIISRRSHGPVRPPACRRLVPFKFNLSSVLKLGTDVSKRLSSTTIVQCISHRVKAISTHHLQRLRSHARHSSDTRPTNPNTRV